MKNIALLVALIGLLIAGASLQAKNKSEKKSKSANTAKVEKYKKYAKDFESKAQAAESAGQKDLAALYKKCAECQNVIADSFAGKAGKSEAKKAYKEFKDAYKQIQKTKSSSDGKTKSANASLVAKYKKYAEEYKKSAEKYRAKGKEDKAAYLSRLADGQMKIAEAYEKNDMAAVKIAVEEFNKAKKSYRSSKSK
jgi:hypothetical protein